MYDNHSFELKQLKTSTQSYGSTRTENNINRHVQLEIFKSKQVLLINDNASILFALSFLSLWQFYTNHIAKQFKFQMRLPTCKNMLQIITKKAFVDWKDAHKIECIKGMKNEVERRF